MVFLSQKIFLQELFIAQYFYQALFLVQFFLSIWWLDICAQIIRKKCTFSFFKTLAIFSDRFLSLTIEPHICTWNHFSMPQFCLFQSSRSYSQVHSFFNFWANLGQGSHSNHLKSILCWWNGELIELASRVRCWSISFPLELKNTMLEMFTK